MTIKEILDVSEVAEKLGSTLNVARVLMGSGLIRSKKVGPSWVTTKSHLDEYLKKQQEENAEAVTV